MCVGVEFLAFNVLLRIKYEQKMINNLFSAPIIFKNWLFNKKYTFTFCVRCVWIVIRYFLKIIGAQNQLFITFCSYLMRNKTLKARNSTPTQTNF